MNCDATRYEGVRGSVKMKCDFFEKRPQAISRENNAIKAVNIQDFSKPKTSK